MMDNGGERPIEFASRRLTDSERNYSLKHKEALSIKVCLTKCHKYLYGKKFRIVTGHNSLTNILYKYILCPKKGVSTMGEA